MIHTYANCSHRPDFVGSWDHDRDCPAMGAVELAADHIDCSRVVGFECRDHEVRLTDDPAAVRDATGLTPIANGYRHSRTAEIESLYDL